MSYDDICQSMDRIVKLQNEQCQKMQLLLIQIEQEMRKVRSIGQDQEPEVLTADQNSFSQAQEKVS